MSDIHDMTLAEMCGAIASKELSAVDATQASLDRIAHTDPGDDGVGAFLQVFSQEAMHQAKAIDDRISSEGAASVGSLAGAPVALKDNMCLNYGRTTCASRILEEYESPFTGTAAQRVIDAGGVIIGKTNMDEFAMGSSCEHSAFMETRNPWDSTRVPGGSSGGSAACVGARMVPLALGSDTGGSIRQPAALCGVAGCKPTYGRVSRYGLVAFASSLDQIGPFTTDIKSMALAMNVICGFDRLDSTSAEVETPDFLADLETPIDGLRIGVPAQARSEMNHPGVTASFEAAIEQYKALGATIVDIELPHLDYGIAAYYIVAPAEASSNLARYDGVRYGHRAKVGPDDDLVALFSKTRAEGFGDEVQRRIMLGTFALSSGYYDAYYNTALKTRRKIKDDFDRAFSDADGGPGIDVVMMPSSPEPAFKQGAKTDDPLAMYLADIYTVTANLAGIGGISIPCGLVEEDGVELPVGLQLFCDAFEETTMLRAARMYEAATDWNRMAPSL